MFLPTVQRNVGALPRNGIHRVAPIYARVFTRRTYRKTELSYDRHHTETIPRNSNAGLRTITHNWIDNNFNIMTLEEEAVFTRRIDFSRVLHVNMLQDEDSNTPKFFRGGGTMIQLRFDSRCISSLDPP